MITEQQEARYTFTRSYWWRTGKYEIYQKLFLNYAVSPCRRLLDAGCGPGHFTPWIEPVSQGNLVSLDPELVPLLFARSRGQRLMVQGDMQSSPFRSNFFDFVFCLEVCEHVEDDGKIVGEIFRILRPGGRALITVPALPVLWGPHDEMSGHFRRYKKRDFRNLLSSADFIILKLTFAQFIFFFPLFITRRLKKMRGQQQRDAFQVKPRINQMLHRLVSLEYGLLKFFSLPLGTNLLAIVEKPG
jgi:SAM-dependent methyltransferase